MADKRKRLPMNAPGEFFVDSTCINCDTCRQLAPEVFDDSGDYSYVRRQPRGEADGRAALRALLACPTGSIGTMNGASAKAAIADFPMPLEDEVAYCGFNSEKSFGGNSYFVRRADGNWLIDSPRFTTHLVKQFEQAGGIARIFLTHRDDVADADKYARRFNARRIIHRAELSAQPGAEIVLDGNEPVELHADFLAIPTSGHTEGHCVLLYRRRFLFSGDHLWWSRRQRRLAASRDYCWHSWRQQVHSMAALRRYSFEWVLPGHGERIKLPAERMAAELAALVQRMEQA